MASEPAYASGDPRARLALTRHLARRVRAAQRATWFPLLVFAAVTFLAIPVDRYGNYARTCREAHNSLGPTVRVCAVYSTAGFVYWPIALVLAYIAIAAFYLKQSRARGLGTRVRPYVAAGIVIAVVVTAVSIWAAHHPPLGRRDILGLQIAGQSWDVANRLFGPACAIGLALLVLAWVERNLALLAVTIGYLLIVLVPIDFGWAVARVSPWVFLPHLLIDGAVLLIAGLGFALAQRAGKDPAP